MKSFLKYLCLYLVFLLPLTTQAEPTGTVIFQYPENDHNELWITNLEDTTKARLIYRHTDTIWESAAQKDGPLVVFVSESDTDDHPPIATDLYLFNRKHPDVKARNLTQHRFDEVVYVDISEAGDVIFTNWIIDPPPPARDGIYLIPHQELEKPFPNAIPLVEGSGTRVVWSPASKMIAYDHNSTTHRGIYTFDLKKPKLSKIDPFGKIPTFSPDGKKLAFYDSGLIYVALLADPDNQDIIVCEGRSVRNIKWSPDGQYIVYTTFQKTFAAPVKGGAHIQIFEQFDRGVHFDWVNRRYSKGYPVEPKDKLTTLWGKLKQ